MKPNDLFKTHFLNLFFKGVINFSLYFTADSFTNKAQFDAGFKKRLKLKDDIGSDGYVAPRKCNCFYYLVTIVLLSLTDRLRCIELFMHFSPKSQQRQSVRNLGCQTYTTVSS